MLLSCCCILLLEMLILADDDDIVVGVTVALFLRFVCFVILLIIDMVSVFVIVVESGD